jgi:hypothetical protein
LNPTTARSSARRSREAQPVAAQPVAAQPIAIVICKHAQSVHKEFLVYTLYTLYLTFTIKCAHQINYSFLNDYAEVESAFCWKSKVCPAGNQNCRSLQFSLLISALSLDSSCAATWKGKRSLCCKLANYDG